MIWYVVLLLLALAWSGLRLWYVTQRQAVLRSERDWYQRRYQQIAAQLQQVQREGWSVEVPSKSGVLPVRR